MSRLKRKAVFSDFRVGVTVYTREGYGFRIIDMYDTGMWLARGTDGQGEKILFDSEAEIYTVDKNVELI